MLFGHAVVLSVVIESAQIDVRRRMLRFHLQHLLVSADRFLLRAGIFLQRDSAREQFIDVGRH